MTFIDSKEKTILSALYKNGSTVISNLAKITLINRTTLYPLLDKLEQKGLVQTIKAEGKLYVQAISKDDLKAWIQSQKKKAEKEAEALLEWSDKQDLIEDSLIVETKHFEGFEGVKALYADSWRNNKEKVIRAITDYEKAYEVMGKFFREDYFKERVKHDIRVQSLLPDSVSGQKDKKLAKALLREMKFIELFGQLGIELNIYDDKISLVAFDSKKPTGVLIKNAIMAKAFKNIFGYLWEGKK